MLIPRARVAADTGYVPRVSLTVPEVLATTDAGNPLSLVNVRTQAKQTPAHMFQIPNFSRYDIRRPAKRCLA